MTGDKVDLKTSDPVNHNINSQAPEQRLQQAAVGRQAARPAAGRARPSGTPGERDLRYPPLDEGLLDGPRQPLLRRDRREGELRDQERPGRDSEGRRLAGGRRPQGFVTAPSGDAVDVKANDTTTKDFTSTPASFRPPSDERARSLQLLTVPGNATHDPRPLHARDAESPLHRVHGMAASPDSTTSIRDSKGVDP